MHRDRTQIGPGSQAGGQALAEEGSTGAEAGAEAPDKDIGMDAATGIQAPAKDIGTDAQAGGQGPTESINSGSSASVDDASVAVVDGHSVTELPTDLYIPPDALVVFLETFEGPLDLLLYLIRRRNLDLLAVSVAEMTDQYMSYIGLMHVFKLDLAAEYLAMAATLTEIKSSLLLPRHEEFEDEGDPRTELIRRLQEYEQIKESARQLGELPRMDRDIFPVRLERGALIKQRAEPEAALKDVLAALAAVMQRAEQFHSHAVRRESLSVRERMTQVLATLSGTTEFVLFERLFKVEEGRSGVVVTFLAITELLREGLVDLTQSASFSPIYLRAASE